MSHLTNKPSKHKIPSSITLQSLHQIPSQSQNPAIPAYYPGVTFRSKTVRTKSNRNHKSESMIYTPKPASEHDFRAEISQNRFDLNRKKIEDLILIQSENEINRSRSAPPLQSSRFRPNFPVSVANPSPNALPATHFAYNPAHSMRVMQPLTHGAILCENVPRGTQRIIENQADFSPIRPHSAPSTQCPIL